MKSNQVLSCREAFRQHTMDLLPAGASEPAQHHWMLQDQTLRDWIGDVEKEYWCLHSAGGDPLAGEPIEPETVIRRLGFADRKPPHGFFESLEFTASMLAATIRETTRVQSEIRQLQRLARATLPRS